MGWNCVEGTRPLCPRLCDPTYTCYAQGILEVGWSCIADSECVEGAHCRLLEGGSAQECAAIECVDTEECGEGEVCRSFDCVRTLGASCVGARGDYGCSPGEICVSSECVLPPMEGGNSCTDETDCAVGLMCTLDANSLRRCSTCASDAECTDPEIAHCHEGQCHVCSDAACDPGLCIRNRGCVECLGDEDCGEGQFCERARGTHTCRTTCTRGDDATCPESSGQCAFGEYCVRAFGSPCEEPIRRSRECFDGACIDRDADGALVPAYCTRTCDPDDLPCGPGSVCIEDHRFPDGTQTVCLAM